MLLPVLAVKDMEASLDFYTQKLGFEITMSMNGPDEKPNFVFVNKGAARLGLSLSPYPEPAGNGVVFMLYPGQDYDIDQDYNSFQEKGVTIAEPIKSEYWGDRVFSLRDPDGYYLTFCKEVAAPSMDEIAEVHKAVSAAAEHA
ncbi:MAG: VOC family protein [bacterium]|nr:VOC family protein [bacterium]